MDLPVESPVTRIYTPRRPAAWHAAAWRQHWQDMRGCGAVVWALVLRDFRAHYRQSILGYLWAVLTPLATIALFVGLDQAGIVNRGELSVPYGVYALVGLTFWQVIAGGVTTALGNVAGGAGLLGKIRLPLEVLVFSAFGQTGIQVGVRAVLVLIACAYYGYIPSLEAWWTLPLMLPLVMAAVAGGMLAGVINLLVRDLGHVIALVINVALLLTPVLYAAPTSGWLAQLNVWNPLSLLVSAPRDAFLGIGTVDTWAWLAGMSGSGLALLLSWQAAYWVQGRVMERAAA